jgi:hypothetical protein
MNFNLECVVKKVYMYTEHHKLTYSTLNSSNSSLAYDNIKEKLYSYNYKAVYSYKN